MQVPGLRWWIVTLLFFAAVLNYIDRQTLSLLAPTIQQALGLDEQAYGNVVNAFLVAYVISYLFSGKIVDKLGTRWGYALFVTWWSLADMATGLAGSVLGLAAFRFCLGLGEAGNWTASPKVVAEWFPAKERGLAIGIYSMGATVGATIAPLLIVPLGAHYGWPVAFIATGAMGLLWLVPWLLIYRLPQDHRHITLAEREMIAQAIVDERAAVSGVSDISWSFGTLLRKREVWILLVVRLLTDPVYYFYQFWFAKYLYSARGLSQSDLQITWVIFLAADIGSILGGWISGRLIKRGMLPVQSRIWTMLGCAVILPLSCLVPFTGSMAVVMALSVAVILAHVAWMINVSALVVDVAPKQSVGTVFGVVGAGSALGGMLMNKVVAVLVTHYSYTYWFVAMAFLHPFSWLLVRRLRRD